MQMNRRNRKKINCNFSPTTITSGSSGVAGTGNDVSKGDFYQCNCSPPMKRRRQDGESQIDLAQSQQIQHNVLNYDYGVFGLPELLFKILSYLSVPDFSLATVCKLWGNVFSNPEFWKVVCYNNWRVRINLDHVSHKKENLRKYIFERFNLENLPLRMVNLTRSYNDFPEKHLLQVLKSLISQEQFISETKLIISKWLSKLTDDREKSTLTHLLNKRLFYEDYDKFVSQDGSSNGPWFGEGWNGSYRIYDENGSYVYVQFDCYCHPAHESEKLKLEYSISSLSDVGVRHKIISADARQEENYFYDSKAISLLKNHLQLHDVSLTNLFCFLLNSTGPLLDSYRFGCLGTEAFSDFWQELETGGEIS